MAAPPSTDHEDAGRVLADVYLLILDVRRSRLAASASVPAPATEPTDDESAERGRFPTVPTDQHAA
jgi:hypothetical protein